MEREQPSTAQILRFYYSYVLRYKVHLWSILILTPITEFIGIFLPPLLAAGVIDKLSNSSISPDQIWAVFGKDLLLFAAASYLGSVILWRICIYLNWTLEAFVVRDIYRDSFDKLMRLDSNFHANSFSGALVSQVQKLGDAYVRLFDSFQFNFYLLAISLVSTTVILAPRSLPFVAGVWLFTILYVAANLWLTKPVRACTARKSKTENERTAHLADSLTNVSAVNSFARSSAESASFRAITEKVRLAVNKVMWITLQKDAVFATVTSSMYVMALVIAVISVVVYQAELSLVFLMLAYANDISRRLWQLNISAIRNVNRALGDSREGVRTMSLNPAILDPADPQPLNASQGAISIQNIRFGHDENQDQEPLFDGFSLDIKAGEKIGLVGHSGSGKTTLTKLLLRFHDVDAGSIRIDGQDIAQVTQDDLRSAISYVPQEPLLFHRSIAENIAYSDPDSDMADIIDASKQANAHKFVSQLAVGYDTLVGERGVKLSGGQRQRIAIARAILKRTPILLLDEATSALDSESEALIQDALWQLMKDRTAVVIAHRLSTVRKMDRIIVLDNGKIAEQGTHDDLLRHGGIYAKLWSHQSGGFITD